MKTKRSAPEIVLRHGKPAAVILDIEEYQKLLGQLEDIEDLKALDAPKTDQVPTPGGVSGRVFPECMKSWEIIE